MFQEQSDRRVECTINELEISLLCCAFRLPSRDVKGVSRKKKLKKLEVQVEGVGSPTYGERECPAALTHIRQHFLKLGYSPTA